MTIEVRDASVDIIGANRRNWRPETRETADLASLHHRDRVIDGQVNRKQFQPERFMDPKIWKFWRT